MGGWMGGLEARPEMKPRSWEEDMVKLFEMFSSFFLSLRGCARYPPQQCISPATPRFAPLILFQRTDPCFAWHVSDEIAHLSVHSSNAGRPARDVVRTPCTTQSHARYASQQCISPATPRYVRHILFQRMTSHIGCACRMKLHARRSTPSTLVGPPTMCYAHHAPRRDNTKLIVGYLNKS